MTAVLSGALNFRSLGGMATTDGRVVRRGVVYRSGELNALTEADLQTLAPLRIRCVFDLRNAHCRQLSLDIPRRISELSED